jgi:hypothetical protein
MLGGAHSRGMTTKRFEYIADSFQHGTGCIVECLACGYWKHYHLLSWPDVPENRTYRRAAQRFRCGACGSKRVSLYAGKQPHQWRGIAEKARARGCNGRSCGSGLEVTSGCSEAWNLAAASAGTPRG